ncbi:Fatty acid synthase [Araneus ventricosus]|uniref:Fatty acid synthase n=1 Tax=Araneus ventricosus TaxID=182803 RepID=A0A4Y2GQL6_ARAVE|nr:Fatty acid synthase [Araneus ventricosus]
MTGMGCQWLGMGLQLMQISEFAKSMLRSAEVLKPYKIDLLKVLKEGKTEPQKERNITASFVGICAIQIALIDVLRSLNVKADGIVGHSTGELACAYADGCCTAEQTILAAYFRGYSVENANLPQGRMAAVGLPWEEVKKMCPKDIYAVCDNADDSVTISGLKEPLEKFVESLKQKNIFARMVDTHGYSFHCEHILPIVPTLRKAMNEIIIDPKPRSERWISSSYPKSEWDKQESKMASAEYFVHNLMSSVLFNDAVKMIPSDAIIIEIGPHFLLQSLLKRTVGPKALYFGLMKRNEENNIKFLMESLGTLYVEGVNPKIERLYPPVKFPVPRGTPMISDLIRWNHSESYFVPKYSSKSRVFSLEFHFFSNDSYILDHKIDRKVLFPATGFIYLAWEALASKKEKQFEQVPIVIERFKVHKPVIMGQQCKH